MGGIDLSLHTRLLAPGLTRSFFFCPQKPAGPAAVRAADERRDREGRGGQQPRPDNDPTRHRLQHGGLPPQGLPLQIRECSAWLGLAWLGLSLLCRAASYVQHQWPPDPTTHNPPPHTHTKPTPAPRRQTGGAGRDVQLRVRQGRAARVLRGGGGPGDLHRAGRAARRLHHQRQARRGVGPPRDAWARGLLWGAGASHLCLSACLFVWFVHVWKGGWT